MEDNTNKSVLFKAKKQAKNYIHEYSLKNHRPFGTIKSDSKKISVVCKNESCSFKLNFNWRILQTNEEY